MDNGKHIVFIFLNTIRILNPDRHRRLWFDLFAILADLDIEKSCRDCFRNSDAHRFRRCPVIGIIRFRPRQNLRNKKLRTYGDLREFVVFNGDLICLAFDSLEECLKGICCEDIDGEGFRFKLSSGLVDFRLINLCDFTFFIHMQHGKS